MKINNEPIIALDTEEEPQFRWRGCDNCANNLGNTVYFTRAHSKEDYYEIYLCGDCVYAFHYGEGLDDECKNIFEV